MIANSGLDRSFLPRSPCQKTILTMMQRKILLLEGIRNGRCLTWETSTERKTSIKLHHFPTIQTCRFPPPLLSLDRTPKALIYSAYATTTILSFLDPFLSS
jgi:hypothetical protein